MVLVAPCELQQFPGTDQEERAPLLQTACYQPVARESSSGRWNTTPKTGNAARRIAESEQKKMDTDQTGQLMRSVPASNEGSQEHCE